MQEVHLQYFVSIELTRQNNNRLGQAVDRTLTLATNVVTIGLAIQAALVRQAQRAGGDRADPRVPRRDGRPERGGDPASRPTRSATSTTSPSSPWTSSSRRTTTCSPPSTPPAGCVRTASHTARRNIDQLTGLTRELTDARPRPRAGRRTEARPMKRLGLVVGVLVRRAGRLAGGPASSPRTRTRWWSSTGRTATRCARGCCPRWPSEFNDEDHETAVGPADRDRRRPCDSADQADDLVARVDGGGTRTNECEDDGERADPTIVTPQSDDWLVDVNDQAGRDVVDLAAVAAHRRDLAGHRHLPRDGRLPRLARPSRRLRGHRRRWPPTPRDGRPTPTAPQRRRGGSSRCSPSPTRTRRRAVATSSCRCTRWLPARRRPTSPWPTSSDPRWSTYVAGVPGARRPLHAGHDPAQHEDRPGPRATATSS